MAITPYSFNGHPFNSAAMYQTVARLSGIDLIGFPRLGTGDEVKDMSIRAIQEKMQPESLPDMCEGLAEQLEPYLKDYDHTISFANSTGHYTMAPLVLSGFVHFDAALIRDGINLKAPQAPVLGELNYLSYQLFTEKNRPFPKSEPLDDVNDMLRSLGEPPSKFETAKSVIKEVLGHSALWRSEYGIDATEEMVKIPHLPLHIIGFGNTFTGTRQDFTDFIRNIVEHRSTQRAPIVCCMQSQLYHSDLLVPSIAVEHLTQTAAMITS